MIFQTILIRKATDSRLSSSNELFNTPFAAGAASVSILIALTLFRKGADVLSSTEKEKQTWLDSHLILSQALFLLPRLVEYTTRTDIAEMLSQGQAMCVFVFLLLQKPASSNNGYCVLLQEWNRWILLPGDHGLVSCWGLKSKQGV